MISLMLPKNPKFAGNKNSYILGAIILFQVTCSEMAMFNLVSFDSSCEKWKQGIIMLNFIVSTYLLAVEVGEISFWICSWGLGEVSKITELLMWIPPLLPGGLGFGVTID